MVGLIQILGYLLCIYLVFKGIEIYQIAYVSASEKRKEGLNLGYLMIVLAIIIAVIFYFWLNNQAEIISNSGNNWQMDN